MQFTKSERVAQILEEISKDPSRADDSIAFMGKSGFLTIHAVLSMRAKQFANARRMIDELGDRFDRKTFERWCTHPEGSLASIYAFSGKGADSLIKVGNTMATAPKPFSDKTLQEIIGLYKKAHDEDDHELSKAFCRCWINEMQGRRAYLPPTIAVQVSNMRFRPWEPPKEDPELSEPAQENGKPKEKELPGSGEKVTTLEPLINNT